MTVQQPGGRQRPDVASPESAVPAPRTPRDLVEMLWGGWPFGDVGWPFGERATTAGNLIRVEEVIENDQVVIRAELPGVDPDEDIEVTVDEGVLTIKAERREQAEDRTGRGYRTEFRYGSFVRRVPLPKGTSAEVVSATYKDGVLEVRMPAPVAEAPGRRITVERG
jgi:HSP20 family protein